jgi:phage terminase large subunit GpA-like protein
MGGLCYIRDMAETKDDSRVFSVVCPCCGATIWLDGETKSVLRSEKAKKAKGSLDDLLVKEHKRQGEFDRKFDATFELQREKHSQADELFKKALEKAEQGEGDEEG